MAFCKECGADLQGAKFCANCGTAAEDILMQQRESALAANATLRQASIAECNKMIEYFDQKSDAWRKYDKATELINNGRSHWHNLLLIVSIIWFAIGALLVVLSLNGNWDESRIVLAILVFAGFILVMFILPAALVFWGYIALEKRSKRKYEALLYLQDSLAADISAHYQAYGYCHVGLPYTRVEILNEIQYNLDLGRCKTIDEAVNIMLDDEYKRQMQDLTKAISDATERAAVASEEAAAAAKATLLLYYADHF